MKSCRVLNHIKLDGLQLAQAGKKLLELVKTLAECPFLMGIHLNDNGIWTAEFMELTNLLDLFGIISDEIDDSKMRKVVVDRPRLTRQLSSMVIISAKREASPRKPNCIEDPVSAFRIVPLQDNLQQYLRNTTPGDHANAPQ